MTNDRAAALAHLSMKRSNEKLRSQLSASLLQLEEARLSMEQCDINGLIVNTYREATRGLKAARMAGDLTMETVDDAMVMLQEEVWMQRIVWHAWTLDPMLMHSSHIVRWTR